MNMNRDGMLPTYRKPCPKRSSFSLSDMIFVLGCLAVGTPFIVYSALHHGRGSQYRPYAFPGAAHDVPSRLQAGGGGGGGGGGDAADAAGAGSLEGFSRDNLRLGEVVVRMVSWKPRVMVLENFLSEEECDLLVDMGRPHLRESMVIDKDNSASIKTRQRTSWGGFLTERRHHEATDHIADRISFYTQLPNENAEDMQILRYQEGQEYSPHYDWFQDRASALSAGQRAVTILMYLSDVEGGGETIFPNFNGTCDCGRKKGIKGLSINPKKGQALVFWNLTPEGVVDPLTLHGGCPVVAGEKWSATRWIRQRCVGRGCNPK